MLARRPGQIYTGLRPGKRGEETYCKQDNPEDVHGRLSSNLIAQWVEKNHSNELAKRLHGAPKGSVIGIEIVHAFRIWETDLVDKSLVGDDVTLMMLMSNRTSTGKGIYLTIKLNLVTVSCTSNTDQLANQHSL